jgi:hypothetical protein
VGQRSNEWSFRAALLLNAITPLLILGIPDQDLEYIYEDTTLETDIGKLYI